MQYCTEMGFLEITSNPDIWNSWCPADHDQQHRVRGPQHCCSWATARSYGQQLGETGHNTGLGATVRCCGPLHRDRGHTKVLSAIARHYRPQQRAQFYRVVHSVDTNMLKMWSMNVSCSRPANIMKKFLV